MSFYNLDAMRFDPDTSTFLEDKTPQGAEWWGANKDTPEAAAIVAWLHEAYAELHRINSAHTRAA